MKRLLPFTLPVLSTLGGLVLSQATQPVTAPALQAQPPFKLQTSLQASGTAILTGAPSSIGGPFIAASGSKSAQAYFFAGRQDRSSSLASANDAAFNGPAGSQTSR